jgi:hypothetical protein
MAEPADGHGGGHAAIDIASVASAIDAAAEADDQSHHGLPSDALSRLDEETVTAALRLAVSRTFYRGLRLIDFADPSRIGVELGIESGEDVVDDVVRCRALCASLTHPMPKSLVHDVSATTDREHLPEPIGSLADRRTKATQRRRREYVNWQEQRSSPWEWCSG